MTGKSYAQKVIPKKEPIIIVTGNILTTRYRHNGVPINFNQVYRILKYEDIEKNRMKKSAAMKWTSGVFCTGVIDGLINGDKVSYVGIGLITSCMIDSIYLYKSHIKKTDLAIGIYNGQLTTASSMIPTRTTFIGNNLSLCLYLKF